MPNRTSFFSPKQAQEKVLVDWCHFLHVTAHPLNWPTIYPKVKALCGQTPGQNWLDKFLLERHKFDLRTRKTTGLDLNEHGLSITQQSKTISKS
jgi:hypothetical protein